MFFKSTNADLNKTNDFIITLYTINFVASSVSIWLFISEPVFIELLIVLRSSQYILKWWNKMGFFFIMKYMYMFIYFLRLARLSQKMYINCLKELCWYHPIFNQNSLSRLSFFTSKNNAISFLFFNKSITIKFNFTLLPQCTVQKELACSMNTNGVSFS